MCEILQNFEKNHTNVNYKKGFYIYGSSGVGKTTFVLNVLKKIIYHLKNICHITLIKKEMKENVPNYFID
jgi:Cdc6-like AAA superfamily ATPase